MKPPKHSVSVFSLVLVGVVAASDLRPVWANDVNPSNEPPPERRIRALKKAPRVDRRPLGAEEKARRTKQAKALSAQDTATGHPTFTEPEMDRVLRQSDTSLARLKQKLADPFRESDAQFIERVPLLGSKAAVTRYIPDKAKETSDYFPIVYNGVNRDVSVQELVDLVLSRRGDYERERGLLRWLPLIKPHLKPDGVRRLIEMMLQNALEPEQTEAGMRPTMAYDQLAWHASTWLPMVGAAFGRKILKRLYDADQDHAVFHCVPWNQIPSLMRRARTTRYLREKFRDIAVTDQVMPVKSQNIYVGTCPETELALCDTILPQQGDSWQWHQPVLGKTVILRARGQALLSLAQMGEARAAVALRNMKTSDGRLALIRGGAYAVPRELVETFSDFDVDNEVFRVFDLKAPVTVFPLGWVDKLDRGWPDSKVDEFHAALKHAATQFSD